MKSQFTRAAVVFGTLAVVAANQTAYAHFGGGHARSSAMRMSPARTNNFQSAPVKASNSHSSVRALFGTNNTAGVNAGSLKAGSVPAGKSQFGNVSTGNLTTGVFKSGSNAKSPINTGNATAGTANIGTGKGTAKAPNGNSTKGSTTTGTTTSGTTATGGTKTGNNNTTGAAGTSTGITATGAAGTAGQTASQGSGGILSSLLSAFSGMSGGSGGDSGSGGGGSSSGSGGDDSSSAAAPATATPDATPAPAPVTTAATAPVSTEAVPDLQPTDIRLVDAGVSAENLGPRFRVTVFNGSTVNVNQEFTVKLTASDSATPAANLPGSIKRVSGLDAGATTTVDVRLPRGQSFQYLTIAVDAEQEVTDSNRSNNSAVIAAAAIPAITR